MENGDLLPVVLQAPGLLSRDAKGVDEHVLWHHPDHRDPPGERASHGEVVCLGRDPLVSLAARLLKVGKVLWHHEYLALAELAVEHTQAKVVDELDVGAAPCDVDLAVAVHVVEW